MLGCCVCIRGRKKTAGLWEWKLPFSCMLCTRLTVYPLTLPPERHTSLPSHFSKMGKKWQQKVSWENFRWLKERIAELYTKGEAGSVKKKRKKKWAISSAAFPPKCRILIIFKEQWMGDTEFYFCLLRTLKVVFSALKNGLWGFDMVITGKYRSQFLDTVRKICVSCV